MAAPGPGDGTAYEPELGSAVGAILDARESIPVGRSLLVAISGIDGSGKGWITARLVSALTGRGLHAVGLNVDGWLNLPHVRFDPADPPGNFYRNAIRFDEMFARLVLPLRDRRSVEVEADFAEETADRYRRHRWAFADVDVVLVEGIYLLKRELRSHYDLALWIDCGFETALERAIARGQEGLSAAATIRAYRTLYFPAQEIHFERDDPRSTADMVVVNDPRLTAPRRAS